MLTIKCLKCSGDFHRIETVRLSQSGVNKMWYHRDKMPAGHETNQTADFCTYCAAIILVKTHENDFTVADAIKIQKQQLDEWGRVLKPEVHAKLVELVIRDNDKASTGDQILRGVNIDNLLGNFMR